MTVKKRSSEATVNPEQDGSGSGNVMPIRPKPTYPLDPSRIDYDYKQVLDHLAERIGSGEFQDQLSSRTVLAREYGVSTQTVTRAVNILVERGTLVVRYPNGTYLA
ncbi:MULTISPECIES: GntR family transcriptional regulator [Prauserella]|nr:MULTISPECIES: GntR family transcriptional regulator [Prauserella]